MTATVNRPQVDHFLHQHSSNTKMMTTHLKQWLILAWLWLGRNSSTGVDLASWSVLNHLKMSTLLLLLHHIYVHCALFESAIGINASVSKKDLSIISHVAVILGDPGRCWSQMLDGFLLLCAVYHSLPMQPHMIQTDQSDGHTTYKQLTCVDQNYLGDNFSWN